MNTSTDFKVGIQLDEAFFERARQNGNNFAGMTHDGPKVGHEVTFKVDTNTAGGQRHLRAVIDRLGCKVGDRMTDAQQAFLSDLVQMKVQEFADEWATIPSPASGTQDYVTTRFIDFANGE